MSLLFALAVLALPARAADTPVLVSALQPTSPSARARAAELEAAIAREAAALPGVHVLRVEDTPPFEDYPARVYIDGCPPGDALGCASIVAERGHAAFAVTGTVRAGADGDEVEVDILDVAGGRVVVGFTSTVPAGDAAVLAGGVARLLAAAVRGEIGAEVDVRHADDDDDDTPAVHPDNDAVAREIATLSRQMGEAMVELSTPGRPIPRTTYTVGDLARDAETDGLTAWERVGMTPGGYLRYKNSGLSLPEWRARAAGRRGQLLITPAAGYATGAMAGSFYAAYATDDSTQVVESWSAERQQGGSGAWLTGTVAYGITPFLDVGAAVGLQTGQYTLDVDGEVVGQIPEPSDPLVFPVSRVTVGPRATLAFVPARAVRPRVGVGVDWMPAYQVADVQVLPAWVATFPAAGLLVGQLAVGGEARVSSRVDVVLNVPITLLLSGADASTAHTGSVAVVPTTTPEGPPRVGAGVALGVQVRLFGARPAASPADSDDAS